MEFKCSECGGVITVINNKMICSKCGRNKDLKEDKNIVITDMNEETKDYNQVLYS